MLTIPINTLPYQVIKTNVLNQYVVIRLYWKNVGLFADVAWDGQDLSLGTIVRNKVPLIKKHYTEFVGNFIIFDTQGQSDPEYTELGSRYVLIYLNGEEIEKLYY